MGRQIQWEALSFFAAFVMSGAPQLFPQIPYVTAQIMFYGGLAGMALIILHHFFPSLFTTREYRSFFKKWRARKPDTEIIPEDKLISIYEALDYISDHSQWAADKEPGVAYILAINEIVRKAEAGEITAYGRKDGNGMHQMIPKEYWLSANIEPLSCFSQEGQRSTTQPKEIMDTVEIYMDLFLNKAEVQKVWPKK